MITSFLDLPSDLVAGTAKLVPAPPTQERRSAEIVVKENAFSSARGSGEGRVGASSDLSAGRVLFGASEWRL